MIAFGSQSSTAPQGDAGDLQYNNDGAFGAASESHYDSEDGRFGFGTQAPIARVHAVSGSSAGPALIVQEGQGQNGSNVQEWRDANGARKARLRVFTSGFDWALNNSNDVAGISFSSAGLLYLSSLNGQINLPTNGSAAGSGSKFFEWSYSSKYFLTASWGGFLLSTYGNETVNHELRFGASRFSSPPDKTRNWFKNVTTDAVTVSWSNAAGQTADTWRVYDGSGSLIASMDVSGNVDFPAYSVGGVSGASGSFTSADGKTVSVTSGMITGIV